MLRCLSTYLFIKRKFNPALVADMAAAGVNAVEIFCTRSHFDYSTRDTVREVAAALRDHNIAVHSIHAPAERDFSSNRESSVPLSICDLERTRRLEAVDEIKRALDLAEEIQFPYIVQHFGSSRETANPHRVDAAFNSLEHLRIFAKQRGVTIALENTPGELATPANLRQFITDTRLTDLRLCFDTGHAHLAEGALESLEIMRELVIGAHVHDNHGEKDEHLPPHEGTIEWRPLLTALRTGPADSGEQSPQPHTEARAQNRAEAPRDVPEQVPLVLELKEQPAYAEPAAAAVALADARKAFDTLEEEISRL